MTQVPAENVIPVDDADELKAIHEFDFARVMLLLSVIEKQASVAPKSTSISGIALAELEVMNNWAKEIARSRNEKIVQADTKRREAQLAQHERDNRVSAPKAELKPGQPMPKRKLDLGAEQDAPEQNPNNRRDAHVDLTDRRV